MRLDIVIPAHNEEERIGPMLDAYRERCAQPDVRFLVALDRCTDATLQVVSERARADPRVSVHEHPKLGKGGVIMETFRHCDGDLVGFVDADCATPPAELLRLAQASQHADGAIASRRHPAAVLPVRRQAAREIASAGFAAGIRRLFRLPYGDTQCGAKVFRRQAIERMLPLISSRDFLFDVDVLLVARKLGYEIAEVPTIWIDRAGSRLSAGSDAGRMAASALRLWVHHRVLPVDTQPSDPVEEDEAGEDADDVVVRGPWVTKQRPDVALIAPYPPAGARHAGRSGVASYAANLGAALTDAGARVSVLAPYEDGEPVLASDGDVRVERCFERGPGAMPRAARAAAELGPAVTHLQHEFFLYGGPDSMPGLIYGLDRLGREGAGGPVVTMHHVVDSSEVDADFVRLHRVKAPPGLARLGLSAMQGAIRRSAERVIVHEPSFAPMVGGAEVVPHGLETSPVIPREQARAELGLERPLTALCFGFLAPYKGLELALEAAAAAGDAVELVVAGGDHPRLAERDSYAEELRRDWAGAARFVGHVPEPDVGRWFSAADLALFMYPRPFSSSGALALALAHETAPLLSPALARSIDAPDALTAPADARRLARRLSRFAADLGELEPLREAACELAGDRSWPAVARRHLEIYEEVEDADGAADGLLRAA
ncbi:MAG: glycosyltransferase [Solirubrobacterales bacterium]